MPFLIRALPGAALAVAGALAVVAATVFTRRRAQARTRWKRVAVASTAKQNLEAAAAALGGVVTGVSVASLVKDQPVGLDETLRGAKNRLGALIATEPAADLAVSIENGILRGLGGEEEAWVDIAVVVLRDLATGAESIATSAGVQLPTTFVGEWVEGGGEGTVGEVIAEQRNCDKQDPQIALTAGQFGRATLLAEAIRIAAATLPNAPPEADA